MPTCITASSGTVSAEQDVGALGQRRAGLRQRDHASRPGARAMSTASSSDGMPPTCEIAITTPRGRCAAAATCCRW